jgi:hypothetical protein
MSGSFSTSQINMAPLSEYIILPWSNQHDQYGRMYAQCCRYQPRPFTTIQISMAL